MEEEKKSNFHGSNIELREPDITKIQCKDCIFREKDRLNGHIKGATLGLCEVYKDKPNDILWYNAECIYYESENEPE